MWSGARLLLLSSLLLSPVVVHAQALLPASPAGDMPCERVLNEEGRRACYELLMAQAAKPTAKAKPQHSAAAEEPVCEPRPTFQTTALLTWTLEFLEAVTAEGATVGGYVLEQRLDAQKKWSLLRDDLPATQLEVVLTDLRPKRSYEWQLRAKLTNNAGETTLSAPFLQGAQAPCLRIVEVPPPGVLQAMPKP